MVGQQPGRGLGTQSGFKSDTYQLGTGRYHFLSHQWGEVPVTRGVVAVK